MLVYFFKVTVKLLQSFYKMGNMRLILKTVNLGVIIIKSNELACLAVTDSLHLHK